MPYRATLPVRSKRGAVQLGRFQPCALQAFLYPRNQPAPKATIATAMVRVLSNIIGFDLRSFAENAVPSLIVPNPLNRAIEGTGRS